MKKILLITGVAVSLIASSAFANTKAVEVGSKGATKARDVIVPRLETKGAKADASVKQGSKVEGTTSTRGAKTAVVTNSGEYSVSGPTENKSFGESCGDKDQGNFSLQQQANIRAAERIGLVKGAVCSLADKEAQKRLVDGLIVKATKDAKAEGAKEDQRLVESLALASQTRIAANFSANVSAINPSASRQDKVDLCTKCAKFGQNICNLIR